MKRSQFRLYLYIGIISLSCITFISCNNQKFRQGEFLYEKHCESCHQAGGEGLAKLYPPLKDSDYWTKNMNQIPCIIRNGIKDTIVVNGVQYSTQMAGIPSLTEYEISNIINYINYTWYDNDDGIKIKEVLKNLNNCK